MKDIKIRGLKHFIFARKITGVVFATTLFASNAYCLNVSSTANGEHYSWDGWTSDLPHSTIEDFKKKGRDELIVDINTEKQLKQDIINKIEEIKSQIPNFLEQGRLEVQADVSKRVLELTTSNTQFKQEKESEVEIVRGRVTNSTKRAKRLINDKSTTERKAMHAVETVRRMSTSASRRAKLSLSRLDIRSGCWVDSMSPYIQQGGQLVSLGCVGGEGGSYNSFEFREDNPISRIVFGASNEHGFISGFGFGFKDGSYLQFGECREPTIPHALDEGEKLIGIFGVSGQYIQTLGFSTNKQAYGPYGDNIDGDDFSILPISGKY
jgi:hypothetical protein